MRLTRRLLLASLLVIGLLVVFILVVVDLRLREELLAEARRELAREAWTVAALWGEDANPQLVAAAAGRALGHRVTLLLPNGHPLGDSELPLDVVGAPGDLTRLPEIAQALRDSIGWDIDHSARGGPELRVAVLAPQGIVRLTYDLSQVGGAFDTTRRQLVLAGLLALAVAGVTIWAFARELSRHVAELGDVARALAAGDLTRRPRLAAPGEIGDLASAVHRLAEQLAARVGALAREEALLAALEEALSEGIVAVDRRQQVVRITPTARRLLGVRADPPFPTEHLPRDRALRDALAAALRGERADAAEVVVGGRTLVLAARPLPEGGAVIAVYDLTQLRRLESVRRDFVANVSHELKTPLTVVGGFAETLAEDDVEPEQRRAFAEAIRANAQRMQRIVDDLLDLSRIESGGWVPQPRALAVREVAGEALAAVARVAARKGLALHVDVAPGAETVWADPTALRQVLDNLLDNAVRHTAAGEVRVIAAPAPDGVALTVRDTGIGIPTEHLSRIFERFYRVDPARSRAAGGTGLGLAIVRHLVEAHGGRVHAESAPGRGTSVVAVFPAAVAAAAASRAAGTPTEPATDP
ncbi:MAG TPA: ATP-binding protein [Gemmatimonadaceae bacterium]|nr:ATP-binding protein [Gemmatimonadaceae bacterium]